MTYSNCGTTEDVAPRSFDLDLPALVLCNICTYALVHGSELFEDLGGKSKRDGWGRP